MRFGEWSERMIGRIANYKTCEGCRRAIAAANAEWARRGSYGCEIDHLREVVAAAQDKSMAIRYGL